MSLLNKIFHRHKHDWDKWKETASGNIMDSGSKVGFYITQEKICKTCNFKVISWQHLRQ